MSEINYYLEIPNWISEQKKLVSNEDLINGLRFRFHNATDPEEREVLAQYLRMEYGRQNQPNLAREVLLETISDKPSDPIGWIGLAGFELVYSNLQASFEAAEIAVKCAQECRMFLRYALNTKARALRYLENYQELDECLEEIANLVPREGELDFPPESDFFRNLDKSKIKPTTVDLYQSYLDRWKGKTHPAWDGLVGQ